MTNSSLSVFSRFYRVFYPDFLKKLLAENNRSRSILFWVLFNALFALLSSLLILNTFGGAIKEGSNWLFTNYPQATINFQNGVLTTSGFNEPLFFAQDNSVFILDTNQVQYGEKDLEPYSDGVLITKDAIYQKQNFRIQITPFKTPQTENQSFSFSAAEAKQWLGSNLSWLLFFMTVGLFLILSFVFIVVYLLPALFWALIFFVAGLLFKISGLTFSKSFLAILSFYFVPSLVAFVAGLLNSFLFPQQDLSFFSSALCTFLILAILFSSNFYHIKQEESPDAAAAATPTSTPSEKD